MNCVRHLQQGEDAKVPLALIICLSMSYQHLLQHLQKNTLKDQPVYLIITLFKMTKKAQIQSGIMQP